MGLSFFHNIKSAAIWNQTDKKKYLNKLLNFHL